MTRKLIVVALLLLFLAAKTQSCAAKCLERDKLSNDQKLERLRKPIDKNDRAAVACAVAFMDDLSRRGDSRVLQILIKKLDLELTPEETLSQLSPGLHLYGGKYPAMDDISWFGKDAVPPLLDAIAEAAPGSLLSQNATKVFLALEAKDPIAAIKLLVHRAGREKGPASQNIMDAARYAVSLPQCSDELQACRDALNVNQ